MCAHGDATFTRTRVRRRLEGCLFQLDLARAVLPVKIADEDRFLDVLAVALPGLLLATREKLAEHLRELVVRAESQIARPTAGVGVVRLGFKLAEIALYDFLVHDSLDASDSDGVRHLRPRLRRHRRPR